MAYLKRIRVDCDCCDYHGCVSKASVELFSTDNYSIGKYCTTHGRIKGITSKNMKEEIEHEKDERLAKMRKELIANRPNLEPPEPRYAKTPKGRGCIR